MSFPILPFAEAMEFQGAPAAPAARRRVGLSLIHGFTGNPSSLRPLAEQLDARGFQVHVPRLPGHGTDVRDMQKTRYSEWRAEVLASADRLATKVDRVFLVGLSLGGTLVLDVASSKERDVAGVVSINAQVLDRTGTLVKIAPLFEKLIPFAPAFAAGLRVDDIAKPGVSERAYAWVSVAAGNSLTRELPRIRAQLPGLACPALIVYSRQDHSVSPENSRAILKMLSEARTTELILERSYHVATLDYDLELLAEQITRFADEHSR